MTYASKYKTTGLKAPPAPLAFAGTTIVKESLEAAKTIGISTDKFVVPAGYTLRYYSVAASFLHVKYPKIAVQVGQDLVWVVEAGQVMPSLASNTFGEYVGYTTGSVPVSVTSYDVVAFAVNVQGECVRTTEEYQKWQLETYDKIAAAYQALQTAYDQQVAQAQVASGITIEGRNPAMNRIIEKTELKKLCIMMMTGQHLSDFNAMTDPSDKPKHHPEVLIDEALYEGPIAQFFEQAFEWEQMTYLFYPYYWGRKKNWVEISKLTDPDPIFAQFLTAGFARVLVPVPIPYVDSVLYLLQSDDPDLRQRVWRGAERPTLKDKDGLYESITEELRDQTDDLANAKPEGAPWEFTLPTTLVWLQPNAELPTFETPDE